MIREWCEGCGERFTLQWSAMHCREFGRCPHRCGYDDRHTINEVAEAFWSAIAHERAKCEALREVERQVREEIAIRHMTGFGRGFTARDAFLAEAPGIKVRQVTTKDEG